MNPYYYLFYKLTKFLNKKGKNGDGPIYAITFFTGQYIGICYNKLFFVTENNFDKLKIFLIIILALLLILNFILFLKKKRVVRIMNHYQNESERSRKIGNFLVILYVLLPLILILFT